MLGKPDVDSEAGDGYASYEAGHERESLLPTTSEAQGQPPSPKSSSPLTAPYSRRQFGLCQLLLAFLAGTFACGITQLVVCGPSCFTGGKPTTKSGVSVAANANVNNDLAPPWVGSTERHPFPPPSPTNAYPSLFPTSVGYAGGTPTGAEPAVIATAPVYPIHTGAAQLVVPATLGNKGKKGKGTKGFDMFKKWSNLSPWYSVDRTAFGLDSGPETPETCRVTGLHFLHRHGARYPTAWGEYLRFRREILRFIVECSGVWRPRSFRGKIECCAREVEWDRQSGVHE